MPTRKPGNHLVIVTLPTEAGDLLLYGEYEQDGSARLWDVDSFRVAWDKLSADPTTPIHTYWVPSCERAEALLDAQVESDEEYARSGV